MAAQQQELEQVTTLPLDVLPTPTEGSIVAAPSARDGQQTQWQLVREAIDFLDRLPEDLSQFFSANQSSLTNLAVIATLVITLKVIVSALNAINQIPLLEPTFESIGLGYFSWFTVRYLIKADNRQELNRKIQSWKQQILG